jgi:DNA ligase (NAD+)
MEGLETFRVEDLDEDTIVERAKGLDKESFGSLLEFLAEAYHNDESLVSDQIYDELIDIYEAKYGPYTAVGAPVEHLPSGVKVDLPYYLGSLRKVKKVNELTNWMANYRGPYLIEDKIDGVTILFVSETVNGRRINKLYTRGAGHRGLDVSHLLNYVPFPAINEDIAIRGELVLHKDAFARVGAGFKNPRNLVSGIVTAKKQFQPELAREFRYYGYRIMDDDSTPEDQIVRLMGMGFAVPNPVVTNELSYDILANYFKDRNAIAPYEMDGLVIYQNEALPYPDNADPRHVIAFKVEGASAVTTVTGVYWEASQHNKLKPTILYEKVFLSGADLGRASGYNARYIMNNNIGPGAKILLTRSGDVIPKIKSVLEPAPGGPAYPDPQEFGEYTWNRNHVELILTTENNQVIVNKLKHFLDHLDVGGFGPGRIKIVVENGVRNIYDLLMLTPAQMATMPGIGDKVATTFYENLHQKIQNIPAPKLLDASGVFPNIGERRFEMIFTKYPNFLELASLPKEQLVQTITDIESFGSILANEIADRLPVFVQWLHEHPMISIAQPQIKSVSANDPLIGVNVVFSGFRSKPMEQQIKDRGGEVKTAVSRNTNFIIMKDVSNKQGKAMEADRLNQEGKAQIELISGPDFAHRFNISL